MIHMEGITCKLGNFTLRNLSLDVKEGYITGLIGLNGAGKTSLLYLLLGLYQPDAGELTVFGKKYREAENQIRDDIGYVLAQDMFCDGLSLKENADLYGKYYSRYDLQSFENYCDRFALDITKKLGRISKGERLKFQFAFALSHAPKLLLLDEPMANFDPEFREDFLQIVTAFVSDGQHSCLIASHLTKDLERIADYVVMLHKGRLVFDKEKEILLDEYRIVAGEAYKLKLLPKEKLISKEEGEYGAKAMVRHNRLSVYDKALTVARPTLEEILYYTVKGDTHVANGTR